MIHKLDNLKTSDLEILKSCIDSGGKFVVFNYRVSLGFISLLRFSPAIFIQNKIELNSYKKKYNKLNLFFGPWFIFKGPFLTYNIYKSNKKGGIDVTKDIMLNITSNSLVDREVDIKIMHTIFSKVDKTEKKEIYKTIKEINKNLVPIENVYVAEFINTKEYESPYTVIGYKISGTGNLDVNHIEKVLYKRFYKHNFFEIVDLRVKDDYSDKLIEQGELIYGN
ncbi:hypothetical protein [Cellulophaga lytica]|uniref:hypothetical protein n=1 Tax=Cellulophaga lytica TaxID=979 RepID=UPI003CE49048